MKRISFILVFEHVKSHISTKYYGLKLYKDIRNTSTLVRGIHSSVDGFVAAPIGVPVANSGNLIQ